MTKKWAESQVWSYRVLLSCYTASSYWSCLALPRVRPDHLPPEHLSNILFASGQVDGVLRGAKQAALARGQTEPGTLLLTMIVKDEAVTNSRSPLNFAKFVAVTLWR
jgi:hypothetical protein